MPMVKAPGGGTLEWKLSGAVFPLESFARYLTGESINYCKHSFRLEKQIVPVVLVVF